MRTLHGGQVGKIEDKEVFALFGEQVYRITGFGFLFDLVVDTQLAEEVCGSWWDEQCRPYKM